MDSCSSQKVPTRTNDPINCFPNILEWLNFQHESTKVLTTEWIVGERLETSSAEAMGFPKNDVAATGAKRNVVACCNLERCVLSFSYFMC